MTPFIDHQKCTSTQFKRYQRWVKKMRKFGAYLEAEDFGTDWNVKVFCPKLHTDVLGNTAIKPIK